MKDAERLQALIAFVAADDRVCPRPMEWQQLYELIGGKRIDAAETSRAVWEPPPPLVLGAWGYASGEEKAARLREHIEWAAMNGTLDVADNFLRQISLEAWHHSSCFKPRC